MIHSTSIQLLRNTVPARTMPARLSTEPKGKRCSACTKGCQSKNRPTWATNRVLPTRVSDPCQSSRYKASSIASSNPRRSAIRREGRVEEGEKIGTGRVCEFLENARNGQLGPILATGSEEDLPNS